MYKTPEAKDVRFRPIIDFQFKSRGKIPEIRSFNDVYGRSNPFV